MGNESSGDESNSSSRSSRSSSVRSEQSYNSDSSQDEKPTKTRLEKVEEQFRMEDEELARDGSRNKFLFCFGFVILGLFLAGVGIYLGIVNSRKENVAFMKEKARKMTTTSTTEGPNLIGYG